MKTEDQLIQARQDKLKKLQLLGVSGYAPSFDKKQTVSETLEMLGRSVKTAGKIFSLRTHGNIVFADLKDETGKIQLFFKKDILGDEQFDNLDLLDIGDFVGVVGEVTKTVAGEVSIMPSDYVLLTKSLRPLPNSWYGIRDVETRFRQRYLDLLLNDDVKKRFGIRAKVVRAVRSFLDNQGFLEVETPILQHLYGGANAKPFKTYFNALDANMYLRIAPELYLKRLIAGGYEKVYEIGKVFRNEGLDRTHNPEFTMLEWYESYADYQRMMDVAEGMFKHVAKEVAGGLKIKVDKHVIDLSGQWPRIKMVDIIKDKLGLDVIEMTEAELLDHCKKKNMELLGGETKGQLIFKIFEHSIPETLVSPTWIIDYPADVSPLSKAHPDNPEWVQRFEGYIGGREICDGWSELTDPEIQRSRFNRDEKMTRIDFEEAQHADEDFLTAMEYGLPPLGGIGVGIDRLVMFFTNTWAIKEVILFPTLRPEKPINENDIYKEIPENTTIPKSTKKSKLKLTQNQALAIVNEHLKNKNLIRHCLAVEATMGALAKHFGEGDVIWRMAGLLHDADWEETQSDPSEHTSKTIEWIKQTGENNQELIECILSHNFHHNGFRGPESKMEWSLYTCDELTGFIVAVALVRPDRKLEQVTAESVIKKFPQKAFAAPVDRDQIKMCEEKLAIKLNDFVEITLDAMKSIHDDLGL